MEIHRSRANGNIYVICFTYCSVTKRIKSISIQTVICNMKNKGDSLLAQERTLLNLKMKLKQHKPIKSTDPLAQTCSCETGGQCCQF